MLYQTIEEYDQAIEDQQAVINEIKNRMLPLRVELREAGKHKDLLLTEKQTLERTTSMTDAEKLAMVRAMARSKGP